MKQDARVILGLAGVYLLFAATFLVWQGIGYMPNLGASLLGAIPQTMTGVLIGNGPVTHVRDGDTIEVLLEGREVPVRLIGVDTPESGHPSRPVECYGKESSAFTKQFKGQAVTLYEDPTQDAFDTYGRRLAYVLLEDGQSLNALLIEQGMAEEYTYQQSRYLEQERFLALQREAQKLRVGLWRACS